MLGMLVSRLLGWDMARPFPFDNMCYPAKFGRSRGRTVRSCAGKNRPLASRLLRSLKVTDRSATSRLLLLIHIVTTDLSGIVS